MDLRRKILLKAPLAEISLNSSSVSLYESAGEDSDSDSMYYSFTNTSVKTFDDSYTQNREMEPETASSENQNNQNGSNKHEKSHESDEDCKDDTVIMIEDEKTMEEIAIKLEDEEENVKTQLEESDKENVCIQEVKTEQVKVESVDAGDDVQFDEKYAIKTEDTKNFEEIKKDPVASKICAKEQRMPLASLCIPSAESEQLDAQEAPENMDIDSSFEVFQVNQLNEQKEVIIEAPISSVQIVVQDPNQNVLNPFTAGIESTAITDTSPVSALLKSAKKSASKIPTRSHFYSPIQRPSLDRKAKIIVKPIAMRRTIYEIRPESSSIKTQVKKPVAVPITKPTKLRPTIASTSAKSSTSKPVVAVKPKPQPAIIKPRILSTFKCTYPGCCREFRSGLAYQDHLKSHNTASTSSASSSSLSSTSSFKCKWCDKTFGLSNALTNHLIEVCTKIPFAERRKLIVEQEKIKPVNNKRKSMFMAPEPVIKKRSPRRQTIVARKSGVVTPKKTMKCHVDGCGQLFTDVLAFANHMVGHKYDGILPAASTAKQA